MLITFDKQQCYQQAEDCNSTQYNPHSPSYRIQADIKQYGSQPKTKMRKDVHHHVKDHRRGCPFYTDIGFQLHDAVRLPSHQSDGSHIIKSKAGNGEFVETGKRKSRFAAATDDDIPRYCRPIATRSVPKANIFPHVSDSSKVPDNPYRK